MYSPRESHSPRGNFCSKACSVSVDAWLQLVEELFGVTIERAENSHTWHPDVQFYSLKKEGKQKAYFYLDPYSRPAGQRRGCCSSPTVLSPLLEKLLVRTLDVASLKESASILGTPTPLGKALGAKVWIVHHPRTPLAYPGHLTLQLRYPR